jgi:hypothetical protein
MSQKLGFIAIAAALIALASALLLSASPAMAFFTADTATIMPASMIELVPDKPLATMVLAMATPVVEPLASTIKEFCKAHGISIPTYYELKKQGLGPAEMRMRAIVRISRESAAAWRAARENPTEAEAEAAARASEAIRARRAAARAIESPLHVSRRGGNR